MKDLDFDELDKAVNSLMADAPKSQPDKQPLTINPAVTPVAGASLTAARADTAPDHTQPVQSPLASVGTTTPQASIDASAKPLSASSASGQPTSNTPVRRSGRFMDVVHPSSDMQNNKRPDLKSREGTPISRPNQDSEAGMTDAPNSDQVSWPDPIDKQPDAQVPDTASNLVEEDNLQNNLKGPTDKPATLVTPLSASSEVVASNQSPTAPDAASSPFLPDTKVEKRPLGGALPVDTGLGEQADLQGDKKSDDDSQVPSKPMPAELGEDLLAIESDTTSQISEPPKEPVPTKPPLPEATPPISISQQYKKHTDSGDQSHTAIYDSAAQPLAHPVKKKSGWLIVVLILVLILLGAGAGAVLYFTGMI